VINGQVAGAEKYRSPQLFQQMWPHLARAYATEAIAEKKLPSVPLPSTAAINSFLSEAIVAQAPDWIIGHHTYVRDGHAVLYAESRDENGFWIEATYLPKALPKGMALTPDALAADVLEQGMVNGLRIDSFSNSDVVTFRQDLGAGASVAGPSSAAPATSASLPPTEGNRGMPDGISQSRVIFSIIAIWLGVAALRQFLDVLGVGPAWCERHLMYKAMVLWGMRLCGRVRGNFAWFQRRYSAVWNIMDRPLIPNPIALLRRCIAYTSRSARLSLRWRRNRARGTRKVLGESRLVAATGGTISARSNKSSLRQME
jgi:hypothetical protein